jgi:hypothetical protein
MHVEQTHSQFSTRHGELNEEERKEDSLFFWTEERMRAGQGRALEQASVAR